MAETPSVCDQCGQPHGELEHAEGVLRDVASRPQLYTATAPAAHRFNARAIARPRPPAPPLTDEQIAALPTEHARAMAKMARDLRLQSEQFARAVSRCFGAGSPS